MANVRRLKMASDLSSSDEGREPPPDHPGDVGGAARKRGGRGRKAPRAPNLGGANTLFDHFAYQYGSDVAWDTESMLAIRISHLRHTFGNDAVKLWMGDEKRRVVRKEQIVFDPSQSSGPECINLFKGWAVEPKEGDTGPFHELLTYICSDDETVMDWLLCWFAHMLQRPGVKMPTAVVFHGGEGTGKNLLLETYGLIHGAHCKVVGQRELESQWNDWASATTFCIGDEVVSRQELRHHKGVLKALITSTDINISAKFMDLRAERNSMHLAFCSNEITPLILDPSDRRYLVVWTQKRGDGELYKRFVAWRDAGGASALMHELLARDLSAWEWWAPPPMTRAKESLIDLARPSPERFWRAWSAGEIYRLPLRSCSADQAYRAYLRWCRLEGERFPMSKPVFSRMVSREADDHLTIKLARTLDGVLRMWLVAPPPEDRIFGEWSHEAVAAFDEALRNWSEDDAGRA